MNCSAGLIKETLSRVSFVLNGKPRCLKEPGRGFVMERGVVCFSVDLEMAWAWCRARGRSVSAVQLALREREYVPMILQLLETRGIAATWAVVGHLFLEGCKEENGLHHPDMPRPKFFKNDLWDFTSGDWYDLDPGTDFRSSPAWYAPDLIKLILRSSLKQEVACHSFSHVGFNEKYCSRELADAELKKCGEVMAVFGIKPVSMVFPGNEAGHFDLLVKHGYRAVRYSPRPGVEISLPARINGQLCAIPESSNIVPDDDWSSGYILWRLKKYVDAAIRHRALCHFWFHPSMTRNRMDDVLVPILEYCADKRAEGMLDMLTMAGAAEMMEKACAGL